MGTKRRVIYKKQEDSAPAEQPTAVKPAKLEKDQVLVKDAVYDELYVNLEQCPRMVRLLEKLPDGRVKILVYNEYEVAWLEVVVNGDYRLTTSLDAIAKAPKVPRALRKIKIAAGSTEAPKAVKPRGNTDPKTGVKAGSIGHQIGLVILQFRGSKEELPAATKVMLEAAKGKGKEIAPDYAEGRAKSWLQFLRKEHPSIYAA